jgi:hypothetical protein
MYDFFKLTTYSIECHVLKGYLNFPTHLQQCRALECQIKDTLGACRGKILPALRRGAALDVYMTTSGDFSLWQHYYFPN